MRSHFLLILLLATSAAQGEERLRANGPGTFEDLYGPSGDSFQAALGFRVTEGSTATGDAQSSFGAAIDDMVVQWREFKLVQDGADCSISGSCASVSVDSGYAYDPNGSLGITVVDGSPYPQGAPVNDCNRDGDFLDAGIDDQDCNDNGTTDVLVTATSLSEPAGESVILDRVGTGATYRGSIAISTVTNVAGVLHFTAAVDQPEITVRYEDRWDGSQFGTECRASPNSAEWGYVTAGVEILTSEGNLTVSSYRISDGSGAGSPPLPAGQDGDGFPDTNETVDLYLLVRNGTGQALTNLVAQISTSDPKIDCILSPIASLGSLPADSSAYAPVALRFKVASSADRFGVAPIVACVGGACSNGAGACGLPGDCKKSVLDDYTATFTVLLAADQFDGNASPQSLRVDLDLNANAPVKATSTFSDGFEGGLANVTPQSLDEGIASNTLSNGRRCQYNDPDFVGSESFGDTECYLGFVAGQPVVNDWHLHDAAGADGGHAYQGSRSLHYGIHTPGNAGLDTYGLSQMDTARSNTLRLAARVCRDDPAADKRACNSATDCVAFGGGPCVSASPELTFKHQISLHLRPTSEIPTGVFDRAVVQAQIFATGAIWERLEPYVNVYESQGLDFLGNCGFDPIDDGNTEDDYFDPGDPNRRFGPSSTCYPQFVFGYIGDTSRPFHPAQVGRASHGPGLAGSLGLGTWVESRFDLSRFRGRLIRVRWLITSIKASDNPSYESILHYNPTPDDDGWYVDDVRITQTLGTSSPTVSQDTVDNSALPGCGIACSTLTAVLTATPATTPSPGSVVELATVGSIADRCVGGALLSEFWIDGDANGVLGDPADVLLRPPTVNPRFQDAPRRTTHYAARVRCSSAPAACSDTRFAVVTVTCPGTQDEYNAEAWWAKLRFADKTSVVTPPAGQSLDAARGDLGALRSSGSFGGEVCLADGTDSPALVDASMPALGTGYYYLLRGADDACNENRSWRTFSPKENPTDPARRDTQVSACSP